MAYIGSRPDNVISRNAQNEYNYTATGGQTTFTGVDSNNNTLSYTPGNIEVYFNGARLEESDFTATNGTSIVLANAAVVNDELSIVAMRVFEVESISNFSTSDLSEGTNLYYTNARADARISAADTDALSEGSTNLYFTNARADARIAAADTDDLSEGSTNLYFTNARVAGYLSSNDFDTATNIVASITDSAPSTLDTLNELAAALGDDANFSTTVTNSIATKLPLSGGTLTGDLIINTSSNGILKLQEGGADKGYIGAGGGGLYIKNLAGDVIFRNSSDADTIRIKDSGNVGIGTTSPSDKLEVSRTSTDQTVGLTLTNLQAGGYGSGIVWKSKRSDNNNILDTAKIVVAGENSWNSDGNTASQMQFWTQKDNTLTKHMTLSKNGNLGIGTASPATRLNVRAGTNHTNGTDRTDLVTLHQGISAWSVGRGAGIRWVGDVARTMAGISTYVFGHEQTGLAFETGGATSTGNLNPTTRMVIDHNGNVGIDHNAPRSNLHVSSNNTGFLSSNGVGIEGIQVTRNTGTHGENLYMYTSSGVGWSGNQYIGRIESYGNNTLEIGTQQNLTKAISFGANNTERMVIEGAGNVGIGLSDPAYKLDVGGIGAIQQRLKSSGDTGYTQGALVIESSDSSSNPGNRGQGVYYYNVPNQRTWYTGTLYNNGNKFGFGYRQVSGFQVDAADNLHAVMVIDGDSKELGIGVTNPGERLHVGSNSNVGAGMLIGEYRFKEGYTSVNSSETRWYKVIQYAGTGMWSGKAFISVNRFGGYNQTGAYREYKASIGGYSNNIYGPINTTGDTGEGGVASLFLGSDECLYLQVNASVYGGTVYLNLSGYINNWQFNNTTYVTSQP